HGAGVLRDAPNVLADLRLADRAGVEGGLDLVEAVAGEVHESACERELGDLAQLDLGDVGAATCGDGGEDLRVAAGVAAGDPGRVHVDAVLRGVEDVADLLEVLEPRPVGQVHLAVRGGDGGLGVDLAGVGRRAGRETGGQCRSASDQG